MGLTTIIRPLQPYLWRSRVELLVVLLLGLSASTYGQPFVIDTLQWTGDADQRINVVFFGDGYQLDELDKYSEDVQMVVEHFFSQTPFKEYQSYFNIIAFQVPSNESGAARDPMEPLDTYFGSSYNSFEIERLLVATRSGRAQEILFDQFPLYDQVVLVVNDSKYGGSGGWLATTSTHQDAPEIALHEIGHSFAGLSDEYWAGSQFARESPNMTQESDAQKVKWRNWIGFNKVDVFPHGEDTLWHKPHESCKMRILNPAFCPVCTETITKRILTLVNPTIEFSPEDKNVTLLEDTVTFALELLAPVPNTFHIDWKLNGEMWADQNKDIQKLHTSMMDPGTYQWEVIYYDTTSFIRDDSHRQANTYLLDWVIQNEAVTSTSAQEALYWSVYPNPTFDQIKVEVNEDNDRLFYKLTDRLGRVLLSGTLTSQRTIDLIGFRSGIYQLSIFLGHKVFSQAIVKY